MTNPFLDRSNSLRSAQLVLLSPRYAPSNPLILGHPLFWEKWEPSGNFLSVIHHCIMMAISSSPSWGFAPNRRLLTSNMYGLIGDESDRIFE